MDGGRRRDWSRWLNKQEFKSPDIGACFGLAQAPRLETIPLDEAFFSVTKLHRPLLDGQRAEVRIPACDAYFLMIYLSDTLHADILADGGHTDVRLYCRGSICLVDLEIDASIELHSSLDSLGLVLPKRLLQEVARISSLTKPSRLICKRRHPDDVLLHLASALISLFEQLAPETEVMLQHMATAICAHLLHDYSGSEMLNGQAASSLSLKAEKAAKEFIIDHLGRELAIADIAAVVGLSPNHFAQEFRNATGLTPHRWIIKQRIDHAKRLLMGHGISIRSIATECGFTDQSHFTKVFVRETGATPTAWRNAYLH